ncbi:MAG: hypothetical protein GTO18_21515 [Anaerolineales bacterium]|nr:hypothetical protein [Anaerolineales bacterium]
MEPSEPEPKVVTYIGDRDIWRHAYPETIPFGEALLHEDTRPENDDLWEPLLDDEGCRIETLVTRGNILYDARKMHNSRMISRCGYEVEFEGYRTLAINVPGTGDLGEPI